jgi:hypothetical protein
MISQVPTLEQLYAEAANQQREQPEANNGDDYTSQQSWPETDARKECRKRQKHGQRRDNIPKGIPRMICDLFLGLILNVQPDKCQDCYEGQCRNKATKFVATLRKFGYEHNNCGSQQIFRDDPGHDFSKEPNVDAEKVSSVHPAVNQKQHQAVVPVVALTEPTVLQPDYFTGLLASISNLTPLPFGSVVVAHY